MIPNKTEVLNLKTRKTQVPMGYLSLKIKNFGFELNRFPQLRRVQYL
jgi:hypothetical protein